MSRLKRISRLRRVNGWKRTAVEWSQFARNVLGALVVAGVAGCAGVPSGPSTTTIERPAPGPAAGDKARVYMVLGDWRTGPLTKQLRNGQWQINGQPIGATSAGEALVADLPPGGYRFSWQAPWLPGPEKAVKGVTREEMSLMLAPGDTRTLRAHLIQVAGLTADDYRMWIDAPGQHGVAQDTPAASRLISADTLQIAGTPFDATQAAERQPPAPLPSGQDGAPTPLSPSATPPSGATPSATGAPQCRRSVAERLRELESLKREGLVTPREYADKRQAILDCL